MPVITAGPRINGDFDDYQAADTDEASDPKYYGLVNKDGRWLIIKDTSGAYRYLGGNNDYPTNWSNRASLTFKYYYELEYTT